MYQLPTKYMSMLIHLYYTNQQHDTRHHFNHTYYQYISDLVNMQFVGMASASILHLEEYRYCLRSAENL